MRVYSPSPTVRSSRVPLYMQGISARLGQDLPADFFTGAAEAPIVPTSTYNPDIYTPSFSPTFEWSGSAYGLGPGTPTALTPLMDAGFSAHDADLIHQGVTSGLLSQDDFNAILRGEVAPQDLQSFIYGGESGGLAVPEIAGAVTKTAADIAAARAKAANTATAGRQPISPAPRVSATPSAVSEITSFLSKPAAGGLSWGMLLLIGGGALLLLSRSR